jgi:hypothetical protein
MAACNALWLACRFKYATRYGWLVGSDFVGSDFTPVKNNSTGLFSDQTFFPLLF